MKSFNIPVKLFVAAVTVAALFAACGNERAQRLSGGGSRVAEPFAVPSLKQRAEGLRGAEYDAVRRQVDGYRAKLAANPSDVESLSGLAVVYMNEARVTGDHPYYFPAAMALVDRALSTNDRHYLSLVAKGSILLSLHRFDEALAVGERAATLFPDNAIVQGILCDAHVELGSYEQAVTAADRMMQIRPDLKSYSRVSYLRELHGDVDGAIEAMRMAVKAGPPGSEEKAWTRTTLGDILATSGDQVAAEREYRLASLERDRYPFALAGLAKLHHERGNHAAAVSLIDSAIALVPEFSFVELKADVLRAMGDAGTADSLVGVIETMLAEDEAAGHAMHLELAMLYAKNNIRIDSALVRARRELARRPRNVDAQYTIAYVLLKAGRATEARDYMKQAMRLGGAGQEWRGTMRQIEQAVAALATPRARTESTARIVRAHAPGM